MCPMDSLVKDLISIVAVDLYLKLNSIREKYKLNSIRAVFEQYKKSVTGKEIKYNVIFGAGSFGILLSQKLIHSGIKVDFFCDNNPAKHGTNIDNIPCISVKELQKYSQNTLVFVSLRSNLSKDIVYRQLKEEGVNYIFPEDLMGVIQFLPFTDSDLFPIGHFYSLYPDFNDIKKSAEKIFNKNKKLLDIDLNIDHQLTILNEMIQMYTSLPEWNDNKTKTNELRYHYNNNNFGAGDAIGLHCMLRILKPRKLIEVGSGYTSAVTLDTNEYYFDNKIKLSFIEPYPDLLHSLLKQTDNIELNVCGLQEVPIEFFETLDCGDILFIDSTHVSKVNSDVNYLFFEIFPRLKNGVYIHLHDIFYPFEYPKDWILEKGMVWNELYLLRAFLQNNKNFSIQYFQNMIEQKYMNMIMEKWPLKTSPHGGSIWLRKEV